MASRVNGLMIPNICFHSVLWLLRTVSERKNVIVGGTTNEELILYRDVSENNTIASVTCSSMYLTTDIRLN